MQSVSRLTQQLVPNVYDLNLTFDRTARTFGGTVLIDADVPKNTTDLRLHSKGLTISDATVNGVTAQWTHEDNDELVLHIEQPIQGPVTIAVTFTGTINDTMNGVYPCYYDLNGEKKELIATQFESHYAREAFPCIDEPEAKAVYNVTLSTETGVTVLGNMPIKSQTEQDGALITSFETTPKMSSYLLAWVIGNLHKKSAKTKSGVDVNIWATPAQSPESLDFALDIATRTIDFFDEYFETPYPLPKSDHVALPDFSSGAMENWGLITYRETALLADPTIAALSDKQYIATVITHELSHQWFGNLVTMKWWNDLWLNESFANMMEYLAVDALEPNWNIWLDHATADIPSALRRDAINGIQAIQCDVHHPDEIQTLFDPSIVYAKGGRLLRMLQTYLGDEALRQGLAAYFRKYAYQNTEANDLWECLSMTSGKDITSFMNQWITQPGYPVVTISEKGNEVTLSQNRFFVGAAENDETLWPIPLNASCGELPEVFEERTVVVRRTHETPIILNKGATAHFITHYDDALLQKVTDTLNELDPIDRLSILQDYSLLAQAGIVSSDTLITLLIHYSDESNDAVWDMMSIIIGDLKKFVETNDEAGAALKQLTRTLAKKQFDRLGWDAIEGELESDTKLRNTILGLMLYGESPAVVKEAIRRYDSTPLESLDPEVRPNIIAAVVKHQPEKVVETLINTYRSTSHSLLQADIAIGLTATKDQATIETLTELLKDTSTIKPQDFYSWYVRLLRNRYGREKLLRWIQDEWQWVEETFRNDSHYDAIPRYVASALMTDDQLEQFRSFFTPMRNSHALRRNIDIGITEIESRLSLIKRDGDAVIKALLDL